MRGFLNNRRKAPPNRRPHRAGVAILGLLLVVGIAAANNIEFRARVDRTTVGVGQRFVLTVTVSGSGLGRVPRPELPDLTQFNQLGSTSSQSTNISLVGGRLSREETVNFIYYLSAREPGELTIGPCRLSHDGNVYSTRPITITAVEADQAPPTPARPQSPFEPFAAPDPTPVSSEDIQLIAFADRRQVWQGEQVTVTWTFYTRERIADLQLAQTPPFTGFWMERLFDAERLDYRTERLGGREYSAATLRRVALFPTGSGRLEIGPMRVTGRAVRRGGFFFESAEPFEIGSRPIPIEVRPLPDSGRPASFSGGVGSFTVSAELDRDSSDAGEPVNLTIRVEGTGNIQLIGAPTLPAIPGIRTLSPETRDDITRTAGRVRGSREFSYPLIPQSAGRHRLPGIAFGFFDPEKGEYYLRTTPVVEFIATGVRPTGPLSEDTGGPVVNTDIRHIKTGPVRNANSGGGLTRRPPWWSLLGYPVGLGILFLGLMLGRHRRRLEADRGYARLRQASRLARRRLNEAGKHLRAGSEREFFTALATAVAGYAGDRYNLEAGGMTADELKAELARRGVADEIASGLLELIRACDIARFSPGLADCRPEELLARARATLERL